MLLLLPLHLAIVVGGHHFRMLPASDDVDQWDERVEDHAGRTGVVGADEVKTVGPGGLDGGAEEADAGDL